MSANADLTEMRAELAELRRQMEWSLWCHGRGERLGYLEPQMLQHRGLVPITPAGMVYFVRAGTTRAVKIGHTTDDPSARIKAMQTGCPQDLVLESLVCGPVEDERRFHAALEGRRLRGEWFDLSHQDVMNLVHFWWESHEPTLCTECGGLMARGNGGEDSTRCYHCERRCQTDWQGNPRVCERCAQREAVIDLASRRETP